METQTFVSTGYQFFDIMAGENIRDRNGKLTAVHRGFEIGTQAAVSAMPGTGKTALVTDMTSFAIKAGYPIHKIIVVDTDGNVYKDNRLQKLTMIPKEDISKYYKIVPSNILEDVVDALEKENAEYKAAKYKPVEFLDPATGQKAKMMPFVYVIIDTVTSLQSSLYSADGKKDVLSNETDMTTYRLTSSLCNSISNYFGGNVIVIWSSHLKDNQPKIGQNQAEKDFKSSQGNKKGHLPRRVKERCAFIWWMKPIDGANQDGSGHPRVKYGLEYVEGNGVYETEIVVNKSRTGTEGRTKANMIYMNGAFNRSASLITSCYNNGILVETGGNYPSADNPHVFKNQDDCAYENLCMGQAKKKAITVDGYNYTTNLREAVLLLEYAGNNEAVLQRQQELFIALSQAMETKLAYELEINNVSQEEMDKSVKSTTNFMKYMGMIKREQNLDPKKVITIPYAVDMPEI